MTGTLAAINAALARLAYTPPTGFAGQRALVVTVDDLGRSGGAAQVATKTIRLSVAARRPTLTAPQPYVTSHSRPLDVTVANGLLAGAFSPDGMPLRVRLVGTAPPGLTLRPDGSFHYVPRPGSPDTVVFQVRAFDGLLFSDPVTVRISVRGGGRGRGF